MYAKYNLGDGRTMVAFSIPPAINPEIKSSPLSDISGLHVHLSSHPDLIVYKEAVDSASPREIELARPQLYYVLDDLESRLSHASSMVDEIAGKFSSPAELVESILDGVTADAKSILAACDRNPRSNLRHRELAGVVLYLAEIEAFSIAVAERHDPDFLPLAEKATAAFSRISAEVDDLRQSTTARYPALSENVPSALAAREEARAVVERAALTTPRLSRDRMKRTKGDCGDRDILWKISSYKTRDKYIEKGWYRPLGDIEAGRLREAVSGVLGDYDGVFNRPGFIAQLRQIAVAKRYQGLSSISWAETYNERFIRNRRKSIYDSDAEHARRIEEDVERLPSHRTENLAGASKNMARSNMLAGFLSGVERSLHPEREERAFIEFSLRDGVLVGIPDVPGTDAMAVYDDFIVGDRHPNAVYTVRMPLSEMSEGMPGLEDIRASQLRGTNYRSVEECLGELDNVTEHTFFFDGMAISGHDGFDLVAAFKEQVAARKSDEHPAAAHGM